MGSEGSGEIRRVRITYSTGRLRSFRISKDKDDIYTWHFSMKAP